MNPLVLTRAVQAHADEVTTALEEVQWTKTQIRLICPELPFSADVEGHAFVKAKEIWFFVTRLHGRKLKPHFKVRLPLPASAQRQGTWSDAPGGEQTEVWRVRRDGIAEYRRVDTSEFTCQLTCACGRIRYVRPSEKDRVVQCRPCTTAARSRASRIRALSSGLPERKSASTAPSLSTRTLLT